jgi:predicted  nucleic acid-binding Zn-ribbon protein
MASTAEQIRKELAAVKEELEESIDDTHKTLYGLIQRLQERVTLAEGSLRGRARTAREVVGQVFASGAYEATLNRMAAMERTQVELSRRVLELEAQNMPSEETEVDDLD